MEINLHEETAPSFIPAPVQMYGYPVPWGLLCCKQMLLIFHGIQLPDLCLSQDVGKYVLGRFPRHITFYTINEAHKQYSLLDTIFNYIFYLGPPGKHL